MNRDNPLEVSQPTIEFMEGQSHSDYYYCQDCKEVPKIQNSTKLKNKNFSIQMSKRKK